jgi:voltage-gated potassium channel
LMYMLEGEEQSAVFTSIPAAMWWAIETLTTVGYGDMVPVTAAGRIVGGVVSIVGIGTLALFSGLITVGFLDQLKAYREQHPKTSIVVTEKAVSITQSFSQAGADREAADMTVVTAVPRNPAGLLPAVCPHCGSPLSTAKPHSVSQSQPFRA